MAEYNPSKIIKDGNTYNFRDTTKIPLAGSNQISGSLIPATDNSIDVGSSTNNIKMLYTKGITIDGAQFSPSDYIPRSGGVVLGGTEFRRTTNNEWLSLHSSSDGNGSYMTLESGGSPEAGIFAIHARTTPSDDKILRGSYTGTLTWGSKNVAMQEDVVPRSGGAVLSGNSYARDVNNSYLRLYGGIDESGGAYFQLSGNNADYSAQHARLVTGGKTIYYFENTNFAPGGVNIVHPALGAPNYEWGQIYSTNSTISTSDARLKNSVKDIDDKLLDAWGNIEPKQYKFNDATEKKGEKARLHTGYLAQDIQTECEKQGVNASDYGLFCFDEWEAQEERKDENGQVIEPYRPKGDAYSLRYEEALIVECAYLRKCIKELRNEIEQLKSSK